VSAFLSHWTKRPVRSTRAGRARRGPAREIRAVAADNGPTLTVLHFQARNRPVSRSPVDGLMARILERHILPVILTLRTLRRPERGGSSLNHIWPGMVFSTPGQPDTDVDLLMSDGIRVLAAECKLDARTLNRNQTEKLVVFARAVNAQPIIAALNGDFAAEVRALITDNGGAALTRQDLLAPQQTTNSSR
jgi:hypothetical protein